MAKSGEKSSGSRNDRYDAFVGIRVTEASARAMRLITARKGINLSDGYRAAVDAYLDTQLATMTPGAGPAGQGDAELAAALRAALLA